MAKSKAKSAPSRLSTFIDRWGIALLASLSFLLYANTLTHDYALDDAILITDNEYTQQGLKGIPAIFAHDTFRGFFKEAGKQQLVSGGRYRPLTHAMFAIEHSIFGNRPFWGHLFNLLYYMLLVVSIFKVLSLLLTLKIKKKTARLLAFTTALLFLVHPVHSEVVANIKGRDEIIALLLGIWSLHLILQWVQSQKWLQALGAGLVFLLALLAKETAITFLFLSPLAVFLFLNRKKSLQVALPFFGALVGYLIIRFSVLGFGLGGEAPLELMNNPFIILEDGTYRHMTSLERMPMIFVGLGKSLQLMFFPITLTHDYYPKYIEMVGWLNVKVIFSIVVYVSLSVVAFLKIKSHPVLSFGILFFLATLFLTSNIPFPVGTHLSERFLFFPSVGFSLAVAYLIHRWGETQKKQNMQVILVLLLCVPLAIRTIIRNPVWKDNLTLFTTDVKHSPRSAKVHNAAGGELIVSSQRDEFANQKNQMLEDAIPLLTRAAEIHPTYRSAFLLRGNAHLYLEQYTEAIADYEKVMTLDPGYSDGKNNLAIAHRSYGKYWGEQQNNIPQAITHLLKAYSYLSDDYETNRLLGVAYGNQGQFQEAVTYFLKAHDLEPNNVLVLRSLSMTYGALGDELKQQEYSSLADGLEQSN